MTTNYKVNKLKESWDYSLANKVIQKSRAVILKGKNLILLQDQGKVVNKYHLIGGNVEENETPKQAVSREVWEETRLVVEPVKLLFATNDTRKLNYEGQTFYSKRKEYIFLCKYVSGDVRDLVGVEGEFVDDIAIVEIPVAEIINFRMGAKILRALKDYDKSLF